MKKILIGSNGKEKFYLAKETSGWIGFTQLLSATLISVPSIEEGLMLCNQDEISGLQFRLEEIKEICTIKEISI